MELQPDLFGCFPKERNRRGMRASRAPRHAAHTARKSQGEQLQKVAAPPNVFCLPLWGSGPFEGAKLSLSAVNQAGLAKGWSTAARPADRAQAILAVA